MSEPLFMLAWTTDRDTPRDAADDPVPFWEMPPFRQGPHPKFGKDGPPFDNLPQKGPVLGGIDHIDSAPQHGNRSAPAEIAPQWATESIPRAIPLTMVTPFRARSWLILSVIHRP